MIEKEPNIVNIVVTELPIFSANFNAPDLVSSTINLLSWGDNKLTESASEVYSK